MTPPSRAEKAGQTMKKHFAAKILVSNDLYDIARRLKGIDKGYYVVYDKRKRRFEVWHRDSRSITPEVVVPYPELDARTVELVQKTRVGRR